MDKPRQGNLELGVGDGEVVGTVGGGFEEGQKTGKGEVQVKERREKDKQRENPWKRQRGPPGEDYQPESWAPGPGRR